MEHKETSLFDLLYAAWKACGRGLRQLFSLLGRMVRLSWRKWYIALPLLVLGLATGMYWTRPTNRKYKVDAVLILNGPNEFEVAQALMPLEYAVGRGMSETQNLETLIGLTPEVAAVTTRFEHFPVVDFRHDSVPDIIDYGRSHKRADTMDVVMTDRIAVRFRTKNVQSVPDVQQGILNYLNSLPQMQKAYEIKKADVERHAEFCRNQVNTLDSFITEFYFNQGISNQKQFHAWESGMIVGKREIVTLNKDMFELIKTWKHVDHELGLMTAPVAIDTSFALCPAPVRNPYLYTFLFALAGWIAGVLLAWLFEDRKKLLAWLRS